MAGGGSKPGERRGGRKRGTPNKTPNDVKLLCQKHTPKASKRLLELLDSEDERVVLGAIKEIYDRGYGKARQPVGGDDPGTPITHIHRVILGSQDTDG